MQRPQPHLARPWRSVQQQMRQIITVYQPRQDRHDILVRYQLGERCWSILLDPRHLDLVIIGFRKCFLNDVGSGRGVIVSVRRHGQKRKTGTRQ